MSWTIYRNCLLRNGPFQPDFLINSHISYTVVGDIKNVSYRYAFPEAHGRYTSISVPFESDTTNKLEISILIEVDIQTINTSTRNVIHTGILELDSNIFQYSDCAQM